ncbi:MAG: adenosylcobinamide-GDP ribazoletransferase [Alphaproteobacteria bacterium]
MDGNGSVTLPPTGWRGWGFDLHLAAVFLTRLPLPAGPVVDRWGLARAMRVFPLIGAAIGTVGGLAYGGLAYGGFSPMIAALGALGVMTLMTGALHEDGLADTADGFGGGRNLERKLEIMRDSRSGPFGVLALLFSVGFRLAALIDLAEPERVLAALVVALALSRAAMPVAIRACGGPARPGGLGAAAGEGGVPRAGTAVMLAVGISLPLLGMEGSAVALTAAVLATVVMVFLARRHIGGYTGDVLGAVGQVVEVAVLVGLSR